ncbi:hypothetical protein AVEN_208266-1 [Araneus ventricosus]|uniref:Uncharacterized protein n=1 Tax=Araneus ventricosus TaxID=182803 RepID=A0A4Y2M2P8_ARAVE|nr:hypothetical protein AVEN_208266-1 [Araneus ventricosus]
MVRSLRNESEDPDPEKERQDSNPTKRNESAERTKTFLDKDWNSPYGSGLPFGIGFGLPVRIRTPCTDPDSPFRYGLLVQEKCDSSHSSNYAKRCLAEWSRTNPKEEPGFQKVLDEAKKVNINLNLLLTTLGIPLFKLPESTSHLAQITERIKAQRKSETNRVNPAKSHPKTKINLEGNKINSTTKNSPKKKLNSVKRVADSEG